MDVLIAYQNRGDLLCDLETAARQLREAVDSLEPVRSVRSTARVGEVRSVEDRLGDEVVQKIITEYREGMIAKELTEKYKISLSSVRRLLRKHEGRLKDR